MLIVAQSPKTFQNFSKPLVGTPSYTRLKSWMKKAQVPEQNCRFENVMAAEDTRLLNFSEKYLLAEMWRPFLAHEKVVVCLGQLSYQIMSASVSPHTFLFKLPHPSGLNRSLNERFVQDEAIATLKVAYNTYLNCMMAIPFKKF